jgi:formate/nitrite transporter FocA (FNT family)
MIQSAISFHIGIAAKIEEQKGYLKTMPIDFLFNTWLGLIHYYLTNSDLFTENKSLLRAYQEKLINNYINLIKI